MENIINSRVTHKHDFEANWIKAVNFIPKTGEMIIYDAEDADSPLPEGRAEPITYVRLKFGDGHKYVNELEFERGVGQQTLEGGEIFNDYENNSAGLDGHAEGEHTSAGWRSHAEGYLTIADKTSHTEGRLTQAQGKASHAEGYEWNIDFKDDSGEAITVLLTENAKITDSFIVVDQVPSTLQVNDAIYITSNGTIEIEPTDSKVITKIEGNVLTLHAPFLADNYQSTKYESDPTIIPIGAKVKYAQRTKALGNGAHAEGQGTSAIAPCSHSEGTGTIAGRIIGYDEDGKPIYKGKQAHAEGYITEAIGEYSHAEGHGGLADGNAAHKEGIKTIANGNGAHAEGDGSKAIGPTNHAEGYNTIADNADGGVHSEGHTTRAYGLGSHAEGRRGTAAGTTAHIEGQSDNICLTVLEKENFTNVTNDEIINAWDTNKFALAKGTASHVEGQDCIALASFSHAEGYRTQATGSGAHAEGGSTKALNETAHAEGQSTIASGKASHAQGNHTEAKGNNSHAGGLYTIANGDNQTVIGMYNEPNRTDLFIVGNGTTNDTRNNIFTVHKNGVTVENIGNEEFTYINPASINLSAGGIADTVNLNTEQINFESPFDERQATFSRDDGITLMRLPSDINDSVIKINHDDGIILNQRIPDDTTDSGHEVDIQLNKGELCLSTPEASVTLTHDSLAFSHGGTITAQVVEASNQLTANAGAFQSLTVNGVAVDPTKSSVGQQTTKVTEGKIVHGEIFNSYTGSMANTASGDVSHAEGLKTSALGVADHSEGYNTTANGGSTGAAHAEGHSTKALAAYSHAEGQGTITNMAGQHAEGRWNEKDENGEYAHILGWGTKATPKNIHTIDTQGNAWFAGSVKSGNKTLATKNEDCYTFYISVGSNEEGYDVEGTNFAEAVFLETVFNYSIESETPVTAGYQIVGFAACSIMEYGDLLDVCYIQGHNGQGNYWFEGFKYKVTCTNGVWYIEKKQENTNSGGAIIRLHRWEEDD